jgi:menaquinone-dependent protoporphyrinogen oxidase
MKEKILVAYAGFFGSTHEIAEVIGHTLQETGVEAHVRPINEVSHLGEYQAVVLGSAIRVGRWLPQAVQFVLDHRAELSRVPTAYFTVCMTMKDDTPENRQAVLDYMAPVLESAREIKPVSIGLFPGAVDYTRFGLWMRVLAAQRHLPQGDFRDWDAVRAWAKEISALLKVQRV